MGGDNIFPQHVSYVFSVWAEVSAAELFTTDPGEDEFCQKNVWNRNCYLAASIEIPGLVRE